MRASLSHMCLMTASPNSEHLSFVAPSIMRWKSYVTVLAEMAPSMPLMIRSAASFQLRRKAGKAVESRDDGKSN